MEPSRLFLEAGRRVACSPALRDLSTAVEAIYVEVWLGWYVEVGTVVCDKRRGTGTPERNDEEANGDALEFHGKLSCA